MMSSIALSVFCAQFVFVWSTSNGPNCAYFGLETGPLIPINTCSKYNNNGIGEIGSYLYKCFGIGQIRLHYFPHSDKCDGLEEISANYISPIVQNCGGGICDHVTIREYDRKDYNRTNMCYKGDDDESQSFIEYSFVRDCWDSEYIPSKSWYFMHTFTHKDNICKMILYRSVDCNSDSFEMRLYDESGCHGEAKNVSKITTGCHWSSDFVFDFKNVSFQFYNGTLPIMNASRNSNNTYFEVHECGGAEAPWVAMLMTVLLIVSCIGCGAFCLCSYCYKKKKRGANNQNNGDGKAVMKPLVINQEYNEGHGSTA